MKVATKNTLFIVGLAILWPMISFGQNSYTYQVPIEKDDGWKTRSLQAAGVDSTLFYKFLGQLTETQHKIHSFLLVKDDTLILEEYFNGQDADTPHDLRSTTKSIRSLLMGIALDKGFIESIQDPISKYLKHYKPEKNLDTRKNAITIEHLLTMSPGWDCNDWDRKSKGQEDRVYRKKDWIQYTLDLPMLHNPGEVSNYCSMGALLIAEIIAQASGMDIDVFANTYLFQPLGIQNVMWGHTSNKKVIASAKRLYLTSRDMAKVGLLVQNRGVWKGNRIVSEGWINSSTSPQTTITGINYGYFWWSIPFQVGDTKWLSETATGNGGQYIMVVPEAKIVAIFTGGAYNSQEDKLPFAVLKDVVLPSLPSQ